MVLKAYSFKKTMAMSSERTGGDQHIKNSELLFLYMFHMLFLRNFFSLALAFLSLSKISSTTTLENISVVIH